MKKNIIPIFVILLAFFALFAVATPSKAQSNAATFNPNNIVSNHEMLDAYSMTLSEIQTFLEKQGSYLANYHTTNAYGIIKSAAEIIYDASVNNYNCDGVTLSDEPTEQERMLKCQKITTISPKMLLVLLQKEQSLIQKPNPTQKALDEATGYGCPTGQTCSPYWKGFGKQVNSAALQFLHYMQNPSRYNFKVGSTYIAKDKYSMLKSVEKAVADGSYNSIVTSPGFVVVTIENQATAALYIYTPHVYNGNYNVYNLNKRYFLGSADTVVTPPIVTPPIIPKVYADGSILKLADEPGIWLIEGGTKRPFLNWSSFISRFSERQILVTTPERLNAYPTGEAIKFPDYSLVRTPNKTIYLLAGKEKRPFDSIDSFKAIGFQEAEIQEATDAELNGYSVGKTITIKSTYVTGALLQDVTSGGVYYVENGTKAPLLDKVLLETMYKGESITKVSPEILNTYLKVAPVLFPDGTLIKSHQHPAVYLISGGKKRAFLSGNTFLDLGYSFDNVISASSQLLYQYPAGDPIQ